MQQLVQEGLSVDQLIIGQAFIFLLYGCVIVSS
jgi:hypothetical protein